MAKRVGEWEMGREGGGEKTGRERREGEREGEREEEKGRKKRNGKEGKGVTGRTGVEIHQIPYHSQVRTDQGVARKN